MADWRIARAKILKGEGGYVYHPLDKGGPTNKGITLRVFKKYFGKRKTTEDLKAMKQYQGDVIFKNGYGNQFRAEFIHTQCIADILVDGAGNSGPQTAIRHLQKLLGVKVDGIVGKVTMGAINSADQKQLFELIGNDRHLFYDNIVLDNPSQKVFYKGGMNRLNDFTYSE